MQLRAILGTILLCLSFSSFGSLFPPSTEWYQVESDKFVVVFPKGLEAEANRVLNMVEHYTPKLEKSLTPVFKTKKKFPIVISSMSHESNGFVTPFPLSSVFYNKPSIFPGAEWFEILAIHEMKHVVQFRAMRNSPTGNVLYILLGNTGQIVHEFLFHPAWFIEGDAVLEETLLSNGGRGRSAAFELWRRTHELTSPRYSYYRSFLGTGQDAYPYSSHYELGYFMATYLRKNYGDDVMTTLVNDTANFHRGFTFNSSVKNATEGDNQPSVYQKTMDELRAIWTNQYDSTEFTSVDKIPTREKQYWRSYYPIGEYKNKTIALLVDVKDEGQWLVAIDENGSEQKIRRMSFGVASGYFSTSKTKVLSLSNNQVCWPESKANPRFGYQSWADLICLDLNTNQTSTLIKDTKLTSISVSPDGSKIAGAEFDENRHSALLIFDNTGDEISRITLPSLTSAYDLTWDADGKNIYFAVLTPEGTGIQSYNISSQQTNTVLPLDNLGTPRSPLWIDNHLFYISDYSGVDNLWVIDLESGQNFQVGRRPFGSYFPVVDNNQNIIMTDYQQYGQDIVKVINPLSEEQKIEWLEMESVSNDKTYYFAPLLEARNNDPELKPGPPKVETDYPVSKYNRTANLIHPHSWNYFYLGNEFGGSIVSNNLLQTLSAQAGFSHNTEFDETSGFFNVSYSRFTPIINAGAFSQFVESDWLTDEETQWRDQVGFLSMSLPFFWGEGPNRNAMLLAFGFQYLERQDISGPYQFDENLLPVDGELGSAFASVTYSDITQNALNSLARGTGFSLQLYTQTSVDDWSNLEKDFSSATLAFQGKGFGLGEVYKVLMYGDTQSGSDSFYLQPNFYQARGYANDVVRDNGFILNTEYQIPLSVIDQNVLRAIYFRSTNLVAAYDYEYAEFNNYSDDRSSVGLGVDVPTNLLSNYFVVFNFRAMAHYLIDTDETSVQLSVNASL